MPPRKPMYGNVLTLVLSGYPGIQLKFLLTVDLKIVLVNTVEPDGSNRTDHMLFI